MRRSLLLAGFMTCVFALWLDQGTFAVDPQLSLSPSATSGALDPPFLIEAPLNGSTLGPTFSVNGSGPPNMTNIEVTVGTTTVNAVQQASGCWEAIFTMPSGTYAVSATSSAGNATPGGISITVDATPCPPPLPPPCPCEWPSE